ncbi:hypothetical protein GCM10018782_06160 [Streptomyces griseoaurantiacus]|nr:hypothetical protein GCM10018782_06160 [Streptomyces griseoaurantiacus]
MITHCRFASDMCRACCAEGRAMFTIVASRTTISWARAMITKTHQRRGSASVASPIRVALMGFRTSRMRTCRISGGGERAPRARALSVGWGSMRDVIDVGDVGAVRTAAEVRGHAE